MRSVCAAVVCVCVCVYVSVSVCVCVLTFLKCDPCGVRHVRFCALNSFGPTSYISEKARCCHTHVSCGKPTKKGLSALQALLQN